MPVQTGAQAMELGFEVTGPIPQLVVSIQGTSAKEGTFAAVSGAVVSRDYAGAVPFHLLVPFQKPFPDDGVLEVSARPVGADATAPSAWTVKFDANKPPPSFRENPVSVRSVPDQGGILVEVAYTGDVADAELSLIGASGLELRTVHGSLGDAESKAFALTRRMTASPRSDSPGRIRFFVPTRDSSPIPPDGVVIADVSLRDAFGRAVHTSAVEFTSATGFDPIIGLAVQPSPLLLSQGFGQREQLRVLGQFSIMGEVDLSGPYKGVTYRSLNEEVAGVTAGGEVLARGNGQTDIEVSYSGITKRVPILVDSTAQLSLVELAPVGATIPRVGGTLQLRLEGVLTDGRRVDLTAGALGTQWSSSNAAAISVTNNGRVTAHRPDFVTVTATHVGHTATLRVDARDGPPEVRLVTPSSVSAGQMFELKALATDDLGVARVEFLINGVPAATDSEAPYSLQVKAPPQAGAALVLSARVHDTGGQSVRASDVTVKVVAQPGPSSKPVIFEAPLAGAQLIEGVPQIIRVTSGDWQSGTLSALDFQVVRFTIDSAPLGTVQIPRMEARTLTVGGQSKTILVPLWELHYTPPPGSAGTTVSIRAEGVDATGALAKSETLLLRLVGNSAPFVSIRQPLGPVVDATAGVPLDVRGLIGDDALTFGVNASLLVEGTAVDSARLSEGGLSGSPMGSQAFQFKWTPPAALVGKTVRVEVQAVDHGGLLRRGGFDAYIRTDQPPQVSILTPTAAQDVRVGTELMLTASILDDGVEPVLVSWSINGAPVGMSSTPPYLGRYRVPLALGGAPLHVVAVARDSKGNQAQSEVTITASADTQAPSVSIVTPKNHAEVARSQPLLASVSGLDDVGVVRVELLLDDAVVFTDYAPGRNAGGAGSFITHAIIHPDQIPQTASSFRLSARAYDAAGNTGSTPAPGILVNTRADESPTVAFVSPAPGSSVTAGTDLEVVVQAKDDIGVQSVKLFADGTLVQTLQVSPYRFVLRPTGAGRTMTLRAQVSDSGGHTVSTELPVKLAEDAEAPMVAFRSPHQGGRVFTGRSVPVEVVASDNVSVSSVELFLGSVSLGTKTSGLRDGLYQVYSWNVDVPASPSSPTLSLRAVARDGGGRKAESTLELNAVTDQPPTVQLALPAPGSPFREGEDVTVTFTVADDDRVMAVAGVSGGQVQGSLTPGTSALDQTRQQVVVVRAPIISQGQPATVGAIALDSGGNQRKAEVSLQISKDTESPKAVLAAPLPPPGGTLEVNRGGALGIRVEVEDNVRVQRVALFVDGTEVLGQGDKALLSVQSEKIDEVRAPNPLGPGDILVSRRYVASFTGTLPIPTAWTNGEHQLTARAVDPAGNGTTTTALKFNIVPVVDRLPPTARIDLVGVPDERSCIAGSKIQASVSATDDGNLAALSLELDGDPLTLTTTLEGKSGRGSVEVTLPAYDASNPVTLTFTAEARDEAGRVGNASRTCELVPDQAPLVRWISPAQPELLTEERLHAATLEVQEDVGLSSGWLVVSSTPVQSAASGSFQLQASGLPAARGAPGATLEFGKAQTFKVATGTGALVFTPQAAPQADDDQGRLFLKVDPSSTGDGAVADVTYRYRVRPGQQGSSALASFLALAPEGHRTVTLGSPGYGVDLSFPWSAIEVESVDIQLSPVGGASPLTVTRLGLRNPGLASAQVRIIAEGQRVAVQAVDPRITLGRPQNKTFNPLVPAGWATQALNLTGIFTDTRGVATRAARSSPTSADVERPRVSVVSPANGAAVVAGIPFQVELATADDVTVEHLELFVDGESKGTAVPWRDSRTGFSLSLPLPPGTAPAQISAVAKDRAGNSTTSSPIFLRVLPDTGPSVTLVSLQSPLETITRAELDTGFVRLLQGSEAALSLHAADDVGVKSVSVEYAGTSLLNTTLPSAQKSSSHVVRFTPPVGGDGLPQLLVVTVTDTQDVQSSARLVIESRRPSAPLLALSAPAPDAYLVEGSIQLRVEAVASDDTRVDRVEFLVNDQPALEISRSQARGVEVKYVNGTPTIGDPAVRQALESLKATAEDAFQYARFGGVVELPPGFIRMDASRTETFIRVRAVATDAEGNKSSVEHRVRLQSDSAPPVADILRPNLGKDVVEGTPVLIQVDAHDNAFVDRVELLAGASVVDMRVVHVASGFPPENAVEGGGFGVHAPVVSFEHLVPRLSELGALDLMPYFIAVRARDVSGNWSDLTFQQIDVIRDREPALSILSPANGSRAVARNKLPVLVAAEDDVAITRIQLLVEGVAEPLTLTAPPYAFLVDVPASATGLKLRAKAIDSYGHEIFSQQLVLSVVADRAPTVTVAQPAATASLTEGRDFALLVAAQDDVEVTSVEVTVEGGVGGTLRYVSAARPYSFQVPLPYGSAGRSLTIRAQARDSAGQVAMAPERVVPVVKDTHNPTVAFLRPANASKIIDGLRMDVEVRADDDVGVSRVTFKKPDGTVVAQMPAPPYRFTHQVPKGSVGQTITFIAEAVDYSNNTSTATVSVEVAEDEKPTITLSGPSELVAGLASDFTAKASDDVAVAHVTFYAGPTVNALQELGRRFMLPHYQTYTADASLAGKSLVFRA
ncbi:MAG TPA: Ig-like domain-containing protein, partial [Archangium sp.]|nr:Ig-like domain-containing protein [Archangium sp.]